jgi:hypothetical protein
MDNTEKIEVTTDSGDFECTVEDIKTSLEAQDYGVVIIPPGMHFICFWSNNRNLLLKGHELIKNRYGYCLHDGVRTK